MLARDSRGNVATLLGFALIPILIGAGFGVDYGRALIIRERMADAADAAALAIGSWPGGLTDDELKIKAQQYFDANFPPSKIGTAGEIDVQLSEETVIINVDAVVPTTFMKLAHINTVQVGVTTTIAKKNRFLEVVLVLDVTGSMNSGGKLTAMKNAANKMVDTLFGSKASSDELKIGVVPFSGAVNVGTDKQGSGWIDTATYPNNSAIAKEDNAFTNGQNAFSLLTSLNRTWSGCVRERANPYELTDDAPGTAAATKWAPYFAPDEPNESNTSCTTNYTNSYIRDGSSWTSAVCPSGGTTNDAKRQCYTGKYGTTTTCSQGTGPGLNCPASTVMAMTGVKDTIKNKITGLTATGFTVIPAGLLWGWRAVSPGAPYTEGVAYSDEKWTKAIVLLTDGDNNVNGGSNGINESDYNAFGFAKMGHLGATNGTNAEQTLDSKTLTVCNAVKNAGTTENPIRLYTIGFQVSSNAQNLLQSCASEPDMFYNSPNNEQLETVFQEIAQGLNELRIAQ
jgi:Flp pilus assembly protein TadG